MAHIYTASVYEIITALCCPPSPRQERWRNYFIARGPESYHLRGIRRVGALWIGSYCHFYCGVTRAESVSTEAGEVKLFCDCSFMLLESVMCYWERPPERREKKISIKPNPLPSSSRYIAIYLVFFYLVLISGSMYLVHASNRTWIS